MGLVVTICNVLTGVKRWTKGAKVWKSSYGTSDHDPALRICSEVLVEPQQARLPGAQPITLEALILRFNLLRNKVNICVR